MLVLFACPADHSTRRHPDKGTRVRVGTQETWDNPHSKVQEPAAGLRLYRQRHRLLTFTCWSSCHVSHSQWARETVPSQICENRLYEIFRGFSGRFQDLFSVCTDGYTRVL